MLYNLITHSLETDSMLLHEHLSDMDKIIKKRSFCKVSVCEAAISSTGDPKIVTYIIQYQYG